MTKQPKEMAVLLGGTHDGEQMLVSPDRSVVVLTEQTEKVEGKWMARRSYYERMCRLHPEDALTYALIDSQMVPVKIIPVVGGSRQGVIDMPEDDISEFLTIFKHEEYTVRDSETMELTQATGEVYRYVDGEYRLSHTTVYPRGGAPQCGDCGDQ